MPNKLLFQEGVFNGFELFGDEFSSVSFGGENLFFLQRLLVLVSFVISYVTIFLSVEVFLKALDRETELAVIFLQ